MRLLTMILLASILITPGHCAGGRTAPKRGAQTAASATSRKRALLVGVSGYCRGGSDTSQCAAGGEDWWDLNTAADVEALEQVLKSKFGFQEVKVLKTKDETTRRNILNVFRSFLIGRTGKDDVAYFHFSGHGSQVPDDNSQGTNPNIGDEIDGLDETLVPSDYVSQTNGSNNIRDDEISQLLAQLKAKRPANVTVTMDSCFSGSNTRGGDSLVRGRRWEGAAPRPRAGARPEGPGGLLADGEAQAQGFTVLSATQNDQLAFEMDDKETGQRMGAFTHALVAAMEASDASTTYRDIHERITDAVTRRQRNQEPQLEGARDILLMSGVPVRPPQPYVETQVRGSDLYLMAGRLQEVTTGSQFSLFGAGVDLKKGTPLAKAEVESVQLTTATLKVLTPAASDALLESLRTARAVETMHNFGDMRLKVSTYRMSVTPAGRDIVGKLRSFDIVLPVAEGTEGWDARICPNNCPDETAPPEGHIEKFTGGFSLQRRDGSVIARIAEGAGDAEKIRLALELEARWQFIKGLNSENDSDVRIKMRLIPVTDMEVSPVTNMAAKVRKLAEEVARDEGGQITLHLNDYVMLEVMNLGTEDVWVSVLDINSAGTISPLWPHPDVPVGLSGENRIPAAREGPPVWTPVPLPFVIRITEPYGWETFKAIATLNKTNFAPLFQPAISESIQRGTRRGGGEAETTLGQTLMTAVTGLSQRRGEIVGADRSRISLPPGWGTASVTFMVKPKQ